MTLAIALLGSHSSDLEQLKYWRDQYIGSNPAREIMFQELEAMRNQASYQFAFYMHDELVGGARLTSVGHGLTLSERLADVRALTGAQSLLEVNRLVVREDMRGTTVATDALRQCFGWVREWTIHSGLVALCQPHFVRLYQRVGARVIAAGIPAPGISTKQYSLINLIFED